MRNELSALVTFLEARHERIVQIERQAQAALYERQDQTAYRTLMAERAREIVALDDGKALDMLTEDDSAVRRMVESALARFASGARNALQLDSVFYMSALLYPDEHKQGEPDNLERLIQSVRER